MSSTKNAPQLAAFGLHATSLILADGSQLEIRDVVRTVPGKRLVCKALWKSQPVYAKIFVGQHADRYVKRDARGVQWLNEAGIATPALQYSGHLMDSPAKVLIFSEITDVCNAEAQLSILDASARAELAKCLVRAVALHHRHCLIQTDMYLKNFLIKENVAYTLDGDGIRQLNGLFQNPTQLKNLATLLSKFDVMDDGWIKDMYAHYCLHRGLPPTSKDVSRLVALTQQLRLAQVNLYADKKVFRQCTDVNVSQTYCSFKAIARNASADQIEISLMDSCLAVHERNIKNGNTCTVGIADWADKKVVIKRYNIKNIWHGIHRAFRVSRAAASWANAHRLNMVNIATAEPLALVEARWGWLRRRAYFIAAYVDAPDVAAFFQQCNDAAQKNLVATQLAKLLHKLYALRYTHGDMKASNIKIVGSAPTLIDLDAMRAHGRGPVADWRFRHSHIKDIKRFLHNWHDDAATQTLLRQALINEYATSGSLQLKELLIRAGIA